MQFYVLGAPGSGRNTVAMHLASRCNIVHIHYRSKVHEYLKRESKAAKKIKKLWLSSKPFPPKQAFNILISHLRLVNDTRYVLDGYPKTSKEAAYLVEHLSRQKKTRRTTFLISLDRNLILNRLQKRLVCPVCAYVSLNPNPDNILGNFCPTCHCPLIQRKDDVPRRIHDRVERYLKEKDGVVNEMKKISEVYEINGSRKLARIISDVFNKAQCVDIDENQKEAEMGARMLVEGLGLDLADPNIIDTPTRIVKTLSELTGGIRPSVQLEIKKHLSTVFPTKYKGMVILEPIRVISVCSHHLLPIEYEVLFGYIPMGLTLGFSKIIKVIKLIAARPSLQEDFTQQVTETFQTVLKPKGIMIVVRGKHSCMAVRGEKSLNVNITSAVRGDFKTSQKTRDEFLSLAKFS